MDDASDYDAAGSMISGPIPEVSVPTASPVAPDTPVAAPPPPRGGRPPVSPLKARRATRPLQRAGGAASRASIASTRSFGTVSSRGSGRYKFVANPRNPHKVMRVKVSDAERFDEEVRSSMYGGAGARGGPGGAWSVGRDSRVSGASRTTQGSSGSAKESTGRRAAAREELMEHVARRLATNFTTIRRMFKKFGKEEASQGGLEPRVIASRLRAAHIDVTDSEMQAIADLAERTRVREGPVLGATSPPVPIERGTITFRDLSQQVGRLTAYPEDGGVVGRMRGGIERPVIPPTDVPTMSLPRAKAVIQEKLATQHKEIGKAFRRMDKDKGGAISAGELRAGMRELGVAVTDHDFSELMDQFTLNDEGEITHKEFVRRFAADGDRGGILDRLPHEKPHAVTDKAKGIDPNGGKLVVRPKEMTFTPYERALDIMREKLPTKNKRVQVAFRQFDVDHTGDISPQNWKAGLLNYGIRLSDRDTERMMMEMGAERGPDGELKIKYKPFNANFGSLVSPPEDIPFVDQMPRGRDHVVRPHLEYSTLPLDRALAVMEERLMTNYDEAQATFRRYDKNHDGKIGEHGLRESLTKLGVNVTDEDFPKLLAAFPRDRRDGGIRYREFNAVNVRALQQSGGTANVDWGGGGFIAGMDHETKPHGGRTIHEAAPVQMVDAATAKRMLKRKLERQFKSVTGAFRSLDADHSGSIDRDEFKRGMEALGIRLSGADLDDVMSSFPRDRHGNVQYADFKIGMERLGDKGKKKGLYGAPPRVHLPFGGGGDGGPAAEAQRLAELRAAASGSQTDRHDRDRRDRDRDRERRERGADYGDDGAYDDGDAHSDDGNGDGDGSPRARRRRPRVVEPVYEDVPHRERRDFLDPMRDRTGDGGAPPTREPRDSPQRDPMRRRVSPAPVRSPRRPEKSPPLRERVIDGLDVRRSRHASSGAAAHTLSSRVRDAWRACEPDDLGYVNKEQFTVGVSDALGVTPGEAEALYRVADREGRGEVTIDEFSRIFRPRSEAAGGAGGAGGAGDGDASRDRARRHRAAVRSRAQAAVEAVRGRHGRFSANGTKLRDVFRACEPDAVGMVDRDGFERGLQAQLGLSRSDAAALYEQVDRRGTGRVDIDQFMRAFRGRPGSSASSVATVDTEARRLRKARDAFERGIDKKRGRHGASSTVAQKVRDVFRHCQPDSMGLVDRERFMRGVQSNYGLPNNEAALLFKAAAERAGGSREINVSDFAALFADDSTVYNGHRTEAVTSQTLHDKAADIRAHKEARAFSTLGRALTDAPSGGSVAHIPTSYQGKMRVAFETVPQDKFGRVTEHAFAQGMARQLGMSPEHAKVVFGAADPAGSGYINVEQLGEAMRRAESSQRRAAPLVFDRADELPSKRQYEHERMLQHSSPTFLAHGDSEAHRRDTHRRRYQQQFQSSAPRAAPTTDFHDDDFYIAKPDRYGSFRHPTPPARAPTPADHPLSGDLQSRNVRWTDKTITEKPLNSGLRANMGGSSYHQGGGDVIAWTW